MSAPRFRTWDDVKAAIKATARAHRTRRRPWRCAFCGAALAALHDPCPRCLTYSVEFADDLHEQERRIAED